MKFCQPMRLKFDHEYFNIRSNQISDNHPIKFQFNEPMRMKLDNEGLNIRTNQNRV